MALALQLMLFIVTSGFAVPSAAAGVYLALGTQNYVCDTESGTYVASTFGAQLYDASFVDSTDDFNADVSEIIDYQIANSNISFSDLGVYIQDTFGFKSAGQAKDIGGDTVEIQISDENTGQLDTLKVSVVPASQNIQGVTLTNEEGTATFVVTDPVTVSAVPCTSGGFTVSAVQTVYFYGSLQ